MTAAELERAAEELGLDLGGAAPAAAYEDTERDIRELKAAIDEAMRMLRATGPRMTSERP